MLTEFNFHAPSFVVAGRNSVHQTGELLNQWGAGKNIMVVCGNKTYSLGLLNSLLDSIRSGGFTPCVFCLTRRWRLCAAASPMPKNMTCLLLSPLAGAAPWTQPKQLPACWT